MDTLIEERPLIEEKSIVEEKIARPKRPRVKQYTGWKKWLNYQSVVRQVPFFLFLTFLAVLYIYNGHKADKVIRTINRTAKEVQELQYEYKTIKSDVMFRSKQSELAKAVEPLGLKEMTEPPAILKTNSAD